MENGKNQGPVAESLKKLGIYFDSKTCVLDPVALLGCRLSVCDKHDVIKLGPCQPSKHVLNHSQKSMQRHC